MTSKQLKFKNLKINTSLEGDKINKTEIEGISKKGFTTTNSIRQNKQIRNINLANLSQEINALSPKINMREISTRKTNNSKYILY
jgi:hypothetical protein